MFQKGYLVLLIVGFTVCLVLVWLTVDFILYFKRKKALRAAKMYLFYSKTPSERLALPFTVQTLKEMHGSSKKRNKRQSSFKKFMNFIKKKVSPDSDENEILDNEVTSYDSEFSDKNSTVSSEKGEKDLSDAKSEEEVPPKEQVDKKQQSSIEAIFNINKAENQSTGSEKDPTFIPSSPVKTTKPVKHRSSSTSLWSTTSSELDPRSVPIRGKRKNSVGPVVIDNKVKKQTTLPQLELTIIRNDGEAIIDNDSKQQEDELNNGIYKPNNNVLPPLELPEIRKVAGTKLNEEELKELEKSLVEAQGDLDVFEECK